MAPDQRTKKSLGEKLIDGLTELRDHIRSGRPIEEKFTVTTITREETPDGPLHTRTVKGPTQEKQMPAILTPEQINRWAAEQDGWTRLATLSDGSIYGMPPGSNTGIKKSNFAVCDWYTDLNAAVAFVEKHGFVWGLRAIHGGKIKYSRVDNANHELLGESFHEVPAAALMLAVHAAMTKGK